MPLPAAPGQTDAAIVFGPARQIRNQVDREQASAFQHTGNGLQGLAEIAIARQRLQHAVWRHDEIEPNPASKRELADVAADEGRPQPRPPQPLPCAGQHCRGPIDADDVRAGAGDGHGETAGAAPELEDSPVLRRGEALPEWHIAARERLRVLPVVERGIVVPALPAFSHAIGDGYFAGASVRWPSTAKRSVFWSSTKPASADCTDFSYSVRASR